MRALRGVVCLLLVAGTAPAQPPTLSSIRAASRSRSYEPPTRAHARAATDLFLLLLNGEREGAKVRALCRELQYEIVTVPAGEETVVVVRELADARKGRGLFAFRVTERTAGKTACGLSVKATTPIALEAPHSYYDRYTGKIAELLFLEHAVTACAWNTAHRHTNADRSADLCHTARSLLNSFTRAFSITFPKGRVIQLHGFSGSKRRGAGAAAFDLILSNGTYLSAPWLRQVATCLEDHFAGPIAVFPENTRELGGTTNEQARVLRRLGRLTFLHVECSLRARRLLKEDKRLRRQVWGCLCESSP